MRVNPILGRLGAHPIAAIQAKARAMRDAGEPLVDFSIGDPREPTPAFIPAALRAAVPEVSQYPTVAGLAVLRQAIAGYVSRRFGVSVDPDTQVIPTTGSKEAIFSTPLAFVDRDAGDSVIWPTPGYPIYERGTLLAGGIGVAVPLDGDFVFTPDMVSDADWRAAAIAWICNPHNPAGSITPTDVLAGFVEVGAASGTLVCSDECYADLYDGQAPHSILEFAGPDQTGVLAYLSLSKRSGMTGYRSGAVVGDAQAIAALKALRTATGTAPPEFAQMAALAAWSDDAHAAERRSIFTEKRKIVRAGFEDLGYDIVGSEAGLYLWVAVEDDLAITDRLLDAGVVVSPGRVFGPGGEGYIRLALVPTLDECAHAVEVVQSCLQGN
jgi:acetylornithine aminotransferase